MFNELHTMLQILLIILRCYKLAETTLQLEALVGDLEDTVFSFMNQRSRNIFSFSLLNSSNPTVRLVAILFLTLSSVEQRQLRILFGDLNVHLGKGGRRKYSLRSPCVEKEKSEEGIYRKTTRLFKTKWGPWPPSALAQFHPCIQAQHDLKQTGITGHMATARTWTSVHTA